MPSADPYPGERSRGQYCFGDFTLDLERGFLRRGDEEVALRPKPFAVLAYLVEHHGRLITKTALAESVWPDTAVMDNSLAQCLVEIRRALGDDSQQMIRTIARRGYVFAAPVTTPVLEFPREPRQRETGTGSFPATIRARNGETFEPPLLSRHGRFVRRLFEHAIAAVAESPNAA